MIIPSIDLIKGHAVQLIGGQTLELDAGDPRPLALRMGRIGEVAVIDLDAARGEGSNAETIRSLLPIARCRVGGGIRSVDQAIDWLDAGAVKVILGTAAVPETLRHLPKNRVIAAIDSVHEDVVVEGWTRKTGVNLFDRLEQLSDLVDGFLITFVEREGRLGGTRLEVIERIVAAAGNARVTIAGGVSSTEEIAAIHQLGADAQVGMALYKGHLQLADGVAALLSSDRADQLWPTVVVNEAGHALGLTYSSRESLHQSIETGDATYQSRTRGLWRKGATSGATQQLVRVDVDCDGDTLRFVVRQNPPGFCHRKTATCWGDLIGLPRLAERLAAIKNDATSASSYTRRLLADPNLLAAKLQEEAGELVAARTTDEVIHEAADLFYFALATLTRHDVSLQAVCDELERRQLRITRRGGERKPESSQPRCGHE